MSAFGRGTVRTVLLSGLSAVAIACAASFAFADPLPYLSPEAPPSFGDLADVSPLVAVFTAARGARDPAPDVVLSADGRSLVSRQALTAVAARGRFGAICGRA